jgi:hypothetical protein
MNYYDILNKDNQLVDILIDIKSINKKEIKEYLLFIYFTCCILGGYESIDYLIHLLVTNIINIIEVDLTLYYPVSFDINAKLESTKEYFNFYNDKEKNHINNFINNLKELKKENLNHNTEFSNINNFNNLLMNTLSLRGYNQKINFGKVYLGNSYVVKNYFINNIDIGIMKQIIEKYKGQDMLKIFKIYFQVPQLMHPYKNYNNNRSVLYLQNNICVDSYLLKNPQKECNEKINDSITNLITSLVNYGDCRELSLILEFYKCMCEWDKYLIYIKDLNKNKNKIIKLIKNQYRSISVDVMFNAYTKDKLNSINEYILYNNDDTISYDFMLDNTKYKIYENHNFVLKMKYKNNEYNYKLIDIMYIKKYDEKLNNTYFNSDYVVNNKKIKINYPIIDFGMNDYNKKIHVIAKIVDSYFVNQIYKPNLINKLLYLSQVFNISMNLYDVDEFVKKREEKFYYLRKKYLNKAYRIDQFNKNNIDNKYDKKLKYFLLDDI